MYQKAWCTCRVAVCWSKSMTFLPFSLPSSLSLLKLPTTRIKTETKWLKNNGFKKQNKNSEGVSHSFLLDFFVVIALHCDHFLIIALICKIVVASIAIFATLITSGNTQTKAISGSPASDTKDNQWLKLKNPSIFREYIQTRKKLTCYVKMQWSNEIMDVSCLDKLHHVHSQRYDNHLLINIAWILQVKKNW